MILDEIIRKDSAGLVARAWAFAKKAHQGQKRKNGDPYFTHPEAAAEILASWRLDGETIAAGLLHDTVEDTGITLGEIKKEFGEEVAFMVDGVTKLGHIKYRGTKQQVENLRKLIFALTKDLRVIFIKLADRLHNMQTLSALPETKQERIALETEEIYAPLAYRLGMQQVSGDLLDLAFHYLKPEEEEWVKNLVKERYEERTSYLRSIKPVLEKTLGEHGIAPISIDFRAKHYSSLYRKLLTHNRDIERIFDLVAMRLILKSTEQCYAVLGLIHSIWPPLPGRIKDYIARPKSNGYRSLHTTVCGPENKVIELQIRTEEMHEENENGIPAHLFYKESKGASNLTPHSFHRELHLLKAVREWHEKISDTESSPEEILHAMKVDLFQSRIFVITPRGDVVNLPVGATPVDLAYEIHGQIGNSCVAAKVNGNFVPLDCELHSGDIVEVLTQKNKQPSEDWLKFVKTSKAREHIKQSMARKRSALADRNSSKK